jgi:RNA polymerase-binding transcription factor DksA
MPQATPHSTRKHQLQARLVALGEKLGAIDAELVSHDDKDWEDLATQRENDEVLDHLGQGAEAEMRAIRAALGRIATDSYGFCGRCGAPIGDARLDLLPHTPFCKDCAP